MYNPLLEDFTVFDRVSDTGDMISRAVTRIEVMKIVIYGFPWIIKDCFILIVCKIG